MRTMSAPSSYKSKGRSWVKLWVGEWLDGTTRYEMTGAQRAFWIDLLTLAGRSRVPGIICANNENNGYFGYPVARYEGILGDPSVNVLETLKLFQSQGKIELVVTRQEEPTLYAVKILSWERYQSEYMRQRKTRKSAPKVTPIVTTKNTERCAIEVEGEVEVEGEGEVEQTPVRVTPLGSPEFKTFFAEYPIQTGRKEALVEWVKQRLDSRSADVMLALEKWKACERWQNPQFIPYAGKWLNDQWKSAPVKGVTKNEQGRQRTKAAIERIREQVESS